MHIRTSDLCKDFQVSAMDMARSLVPLIFGIPVQAKTKMVRAVHGVSLSIEEGERVGIIGTNGAGKTTLLRLISGLLEPSKGTLDVAGHVDCVMTLGVGLREGLTGRENVYIDGEINGRTKAYTKSIIDELIAFTELGEFIDHPVRTYSSGMKSRLAFGMLTYIQPEILIIDEALSAGDMHFVAKASAKVKEICSRGKILLIVSHSMPTIVQMCNRCIWIEHGEVVMDGEPPRVTEAYLESVRRKEEEKLIEKFRNLRSLSWFPDCEISGLRMLDGAGSEKAIFEVGEEMVASFSVRAGRDVRRPDVVLSMERAEGTLLTRNSALEECADPLTLSRQVTFTVPFGHLKLGKGTYFIKVDLVDRAEGIEQRLASASAIFKIDNSWYPYENPLLFHPAKWSVTEVPKA